MIALVLTVALLASPAPGRPAAGTSGARAPAREAAKDVPTDVPTDAGKDAAPADGTRATAGAPDAAADKPVDQDVLGFLSLTQSTASRDGGVKLPWDGPGGTQLKLSWDALDRRNEALSVGDMMARSLVEAVRTFYDSEGGVDPEGMKKKLRALVGAPMEEARTSYLDAVTWEERRLFFVERAITLASRDGSTLPGVDAGLVQRRGQAIRNGQVKKALGAQMDGYRDLALGLVAYLDGDNFGALERVRNAAQALPEFAVAHAFLGSIYFLFDQKDAAVASWRRAYKLDPTNKAVAEALKEHGRTKKQPQPSNN